MYAIDVARGIIYDKIAENATIEEKCYKHTCQRCGHSWKSENSKPANCAKADCRAPSWNMVKSE